MEEFSKPQSLPPYPQMILEAIDAHNNKEGSSKSTISSYIESTYGELPAGHSTLLTDHLTQMKESGELVLLKNNYSRSDPNAPPVQKRGRGRPPKARDPSEVATATAADVESKGPSRGRGRPKKDPNAPSAPKKAKADAEPSKTGRPRGRPKKVQQPTELGQNGVEAN